MQVFNVALFRAFHAYILDITSYIPNAGERAIKEGDEHGPTQTFHQIVYLITGHTDEHLEEIRAIRHAHGR
ncbi:hypothetical protein KDH_24880 [Dictyobacter sp. S3.2.2.5]|uniref:DinB-like domain-containing protein n=1 Tax=Dictyobacter halimunensis TaxID=3026934 RepID=A0ABQ6FN18_9CHLR|nr:hypothetical protein KDH_24880 [Dictyobacter sp. S3.2.2.5]